MIYILFKIKINRINLGYYMEKLRKKINEITINKTFNKDYIIDGDYVYFGTYPQTIKDKNIEILGKLNYNNRDYYVGSDDNVYELVESFTDNPLYSFSNGEKVTYGGEYFFKIELVKWRILYKDKNKMFVFSDVLLRPYIFDSKTNGYNKSAIKKYLNEEMIYEMFNDNQINRILETEYGKLFLLNENEISNSLCGFNNDNYSFDSLREKKVTDYGIAKGIWYTTDKEYFKNGYYWLRTDSELVKKLSYVNVIHCMGKMRFTFANLQNCGVCPGMWIKL